MHFPEKSHWVGLFAFVFLSIFVINTLANNVPAVGQLEGGLGRLTQ